MTDRRRIGAAADYCRKLFVRFGISEKLFPGFCAVGNVIGYHADRFEGAADFFAGEIRKRKGYAKASAKEYRSMRLSAVSDAIFLSSAQGIYPSTKP